MSAVVIDNVLLLDVLGDQSGLLGLIVLGHFLGVAAGGLGRLEFFVFDRDEFGAEALDLLLGSRAHVGRGDDGAEPARSRDRLQAGDTGAHDECLGRRNRAGRGHHHRQRPAEFLGGINDGAVAGEIGLAGEHVHPLRAGDARQKLHRESGDAGLGHGAQRVLMPIGVHDGDDDRAFFQLRQLDRIRASHLEHDIGAGQRIAGDSGAGRGIVGVENAGLDACTRFDGNLGAKADHFLDGFGSRGHARLAQIGFGNNRDFHQSSDGGNGRQSADVGICG